MRIFWAHAGTGVHLITPQGPLTSPREDNVVTLVILKADHHVQLIRYQSNQTNLVSESKEFIMRRVKHLLEVAPVEQVILTYQHLQIMNKHVWWICYFYSQHFVAWRYMFSLLLVSITFFRGCLTCTRMERMRSSNTTPTDTQITVPWVFVNWWKIPLLFFSGWSIWREWQREIKYEGHLEVPTVIYVLPRSIRTVWIFGFQEQFRAFTESQGRH